MKALVFNGVTFLSVAVVIVCGCMLDSVNPLPLKLTALALAWLLWVIAKREGIL